MFILIQSKLLGRYIRRLLLLGLLFIVSCVSPSKRVNVDRSQVAKKTKVKHEKIVPHESIVKAPLQQTTDLPNESKVESQKDIVATVEYDIPNPESEDIGYTTNELRVDLFFSQAEVNLNPPPEIGLWRGDSKILINKSGHHCPKDPNFYPANMFSDPLKVKSSEWKKLYFEKCGLQLFAVNEMSEIQQVEIKSITPTNGTPCADFDLELVAELNFAKPINNYFIVGHNNGKSKNFNFIAENKLLSNKSIEPYEHTLPSSHKFISHREFLIGEKENLIRLIEVISEGKELISQSMHDDPEIRNGIFVHYLVRKNDYPATFMMNFNSMENQKFRGVADVNNDGQLDLIFGNPVKFIYLRTPNGYMMFSIATSALEDMEGVGC